ncbi:hypothetical protein [Brevibacillus laterosporus]|nr:hypothetical protein [Brevibacillus laterosporus]
MFLNPTVSIMFAWMTNLPIPQNFTRSHGRVVKASLKQEKFIK